MALVCAILAFACMGDGGDGGSPAPGPPPTGVPSAARGVAEPTGLGGRTPQATGDDGRVFESSDCADGVLTLVTDRERIFAELPCDRALPPEVEQRFAGAAVTVRVLPGSKIFVDSDTAGSLEFTVGRVWVEPR